MIAIGPKAHGIVAIGGVAVGVFAFGGLAAGLFSFGGLALGLLFAWGGLAAGLFVYGGLALGVVAFGGMAVGVIASGGTAAGIWVPGAGDALWSYFNWDTVPTWWKGIGHLLSFDPNSAREVHAFQNFVGALNVIMTSVLLLGLGWPMLFTMKEAKRIKAIDGACGYK